MTTGAVSIAFSSIFADKRYEKMTSFHERGSIPTQGVPVIDDYDVIICGAGPAGIGATIAAARSGARTLLIEYLAHVGGMATSANTISWCDTPGGPVFDELVERLKRVGAAEINYVPERYHRPGRIRFHAETLKIAALDMILESGAKVSFCTIAESAWTNEGKVSGVFIANKAGRSKIKASVVTDATGDGDIAASAGAQFHKGDPKDGRLQHVNFRFSMEGINGKGFKQDGPSEEALLEMIKVAQKEGRIRPPRGIFSPAPETFPYDLANHRMNHGYWEIQGVDSTDPVAVNETLCDCHQAVMDILRFCRKHLPGYEKCRVGKLQTLLGVRESRRILGRYLLTRKDVVCARKFEDGIARASFWIDFHDSPPGHTLPYSLDYVKATRPAEGDWYEIPYGCLVPKEISGILVAGRCISCDRDAQASLRVMPTCFFTGAAAGRAATMSVSQSILPHELDGRQVRQALLE